MKWLGIETFVAVLLVAVANATSVFISWDADMCSNVTGVTVYLKDDPEVIAKVASRYAEATISDIAKIDSILSVRVEHGSDEVLTVQFDKTMYSFTPCKRHVITLTGGKYHRNESKNVLQRRMRSRGTPGGDSRYESGRATGGKSRFEY